MNDIYLAAKFLRQNHSHPKGLSPVILRNAWEYFPEYVQMDVFGALCEHFKSGVPKNSWVYTVGPHLETLGRRKENLHRLVYEGFHGFQPLMNEMLAMYRDPEGTSLILHMIPGHLDGFPGGYYMLANNVKGPFQNGCITTTLMVGNGLGEMRAKSYYSGLTALPTEYEMDMGSLFAGRPFHTLDALGFLPIYPHF